MPTSRHKTNEQEKDNDLLLDSPVPDFIPYACHYDKDTILTKNGELLQTIKIGGFSYEKLGDTELNLRNAVKSLIAEKISSNNLALYFHTIRRKQNLDSSTPIKPGFAKNLHDNWVAQNSWDNKFTNELHITIVSGGTPLQVGFKNLFKMLFVDSVIKGHDKKLEASAKELHAITASMVETLAPYGATKLSIKPDPEIGYHSELLQFFGSIIHLKKHKTTVPKIDLAKHLAKYKVAFGNNALEVRKNNDRFFATILSFKECNHAALNAIDRFLQIPKQFVITQTMNFIPQKQATDQHEYQEYILGVSRDDYFKKLSALDTAAELASKKNNPTSFCESQTTIMLIEDSLDDLHESLIEVHEQLAALGIPTVREDLNMEHCFWSQLPGNFRFIMRKSIIPSSDIGSFASLYNFPFGSLTSKWGKPVTLLKTIIGTPYFFNFHVGDNGNSIIVGDNHRNTITLLNFLLSEALQFSPKMLYLDSDAQSEFFIKALGGQYKAFDTSPKEGLVKFNPLLLPDTAQNRDFLKYWFVFLLDKYSDPSDLETYLKAIDSAITIIFETPESERKISNIAKFFSDTAFAEINKDVIKKMAPWLGKGIWAHIFDNDTDDLLSMSQSQILGLDMTAIYDTPMGFDLPVLTYILHFFKTYFTNENLPSILAVASGNRVFNNIYFEKNLEYILEDLKNLNAATIVSASFRSETVNWSGIVGQVYNQRMATKIFLDIDLSFQNVNDIFGLSDQETMYLHALDKKKLQFIVRQEDASVMSEINLNGSNELKILSPSKAQYKTGKKIITESGDDPENWVNEYYEQS